AGLTILEDFDRDGMADFWELAYFYDPTDPTDALLDDDGDGWTTRQEFELGTNPYDPLNESHPIALFASAGTNQLSLVFDVPPGLPQLQATNYALQLDSQTVRIQQVSPSSDDPNSVTLVLDAPLTGSQTYALTVANLTNRIIFPVPFSVPNGFSYICPSDLSPGSICPPQTSASLTEVGQVAYFQTGFFSPKSVNFQWITDGV